MPLGQPWRVGKRPYGRSALSIAAACLKGFYLHQAALGVNVGLGEKLDGTRLPSRVDRRRSLLGHVKSVMPANPLSPKGPAPPAPEDAARRGEGEAAGDGELGPGPDGGDLAGRRRASDRRTLRAAPGRPAPAGRTRPATSAAALTCMSATGRRTPTCNRAEAKTKHSWRVEHGTVTGGLIKRVSPEMVHTYFEYLTSEYPHGAVQHGMLLVQLHGARVGQPWAPGRGPADARPGPGNAPGSGW